MNERIQELVEQVGGISHDDDGNQLPVMLVGTSAVEKFAELIVAECAGIYSKIDNGNSHMGTDNYLEALHKTFRS